MVFNTQKMFSIYRFNLESKINILGSRCPRITWIIEPFFFSLFFHHCRCKGLNFICKLQDEDKRGFTRLCSTLKKINKLWTLLTIFSFPSPAWGEVFVVLLLLFTFCSHWFLGFRRLSFFFLLIDFWAKWCEMKYRKKRNTRKGN